MGVFTRAIRPRSGDEIPNGNDPLTDAAPGTVGPPAVNPGDPHGLVFEGESPPSLPPPRIVPSAWSGWPSEWQTPNWGNATSRLTDIAWTCVDLNANVFSMMEPYLVGAAETLDARWLENPDPDLYTSWEEFAKTLFWDYQLGEAFVLCTARYATGFPARFHVVPPWAVNVEMDNGRRRYTIGSIPISSGLPFGDILHIRYKSTVDDAHGHGPLEAGWTKLVAAETLARYATTVAANGLIPSSILEAPDEMSPEQAATLRDDWVLQRSANPGYPAVLSGGLKWTPTQLNPSEMNIKDQLEYFQSQICTMLGVDPYLLALPRGGDSMTYANASQLFDAHWRLQLQPRVKTVTKALSGWLLPRGTLVEVNKDAYVQPAPLERAQIAQILNSIRDDNGTPVLTVDQIKEVERLNLATQPLVSGPVTP